MPVFPGRRLAAVLSTLILVGVVLLAAIQRSPASGALAEWLRFLPYPFVWLVALPAMVHAACTGRTIARLLAAAGLAASLAIPDPHWNVAGWTWAPSRTSPGAARPAGAATLRVMTYNAKAYLEWSEPGHLHQIAAEVRRQQPDIVVLQDAIELGESVRRGRLGLQAFGMRPGGHVHAHGQFMVLSRWPLHDCQARALPPRPGADYLACRVRLPDAGDVPLVTLHLLTPRSGLNAVRREPAQVDAWDAWRDNYATRVGEGAQVAAAIAALDPAERDRVLVGGDFNAVASSAILRRFAAVGLRDAFDEAGHGFGHTIGHALRIGVDLLRIDHLLAGRCWQARRVRIGARDISEHRAVIADLQWRADAAGCSAGIPLAPTARAARLLQPQLPM